MGTKTYDNDMNVVGKVTQSGTPSAGGDLVTITHLNTQLTGKQSVVAGLTDLISRWIAASASGAASLDFAEDTDTGTNRIRLIAETPLGGDFTVTIPGVTGTLYISGGTDVAVADGGTGRSTSTTAYGVLAAGTTATGPQQTISPGTANHVLVSGGASSLASFIALVFGTHVTGTLAQLNTAVTDADVASLAGAETLQNKTLGSGTVLPVHIAVALSDLSTDLTTGTAKEVLHLPYAMTLTGVYAELATVSSSGLVTVDINEGAGSGTTILSTKLSIDASEETSSTAATPAVISDSALAANARLTFDIDAAGTGAKGLKVHLLGTRTV